MVNLVVCDVCKLEFKPKLDEKYLGAMMTKVYIKCPRCGKKHLVMVKTNKARNMIRSKEKLLMLKTKGAKELASNVCRELKKELDRYNIGAV